MRSFKKYLIGVAKKGIRKKSEAITEEIRKENFPELVKAKPSFKINKFKNLIHVVYHIKRILKATKEERSLINN